MTRETYTHEAYGMVRAARVSGQANLFAVDYPQQHYIELTVSRAEHSRNLSNDWYFAREELVTIALSEVQWARMISSLNTEGVPCTLTRYRNEEGNNVSVKMPDLSTDKAALFAGEVSRTAKKAATSVDEAFVKLQEMLKGSTIKKGDAAELLRSLENARMQLASNIPFVIEQAEEAIETAVEAGKAEVSAHVEFTMQKLGERALGSAIVSELGYTPGTDVKELGRLISNSLTDKSKE